MLKCVVFVLRLKKIIIESFEKEILSWKDCPGKAHLWLVLEYSCVVCICIHAFIGGTSSRDRLWLTEAERAFTGQVLSTSQTQFNLGNQV